MTNSIQAIAANLKQVQKRISAAEQEFSREAGSVLLLAVSKTKPSEDLLAAYHAGQRAFGENYLQEAIDKMEQLADLDIEWHFIGPIQSNKTRPIAEHFDWVHSVDRHKIAQRLNDQRPEHLPPLNICIQVNTSGESSKSGCTPEEARALVEKISSLPRLRLRGFMTIPAAIEDPRQQRVPFHQLGQLRDQLNQSGFSLDTLSMGMSGDMEAAIAEGATIVRIGTDIFGARNY
jgi:pyridoxal phosphate enzyme (YggS family)